jgi:hypothetical protein
LYISKKSITFAGDFVRLCKITTNNYKPQTTKTMASIQDIHALEERIYDAVQEYLDNPDGYENATLHVYLDEDEMEYRAEMEDNLQGTEDDGIYPIADLIRDGEPDNDKASDIANSWIFLD